MLKLYYADVSDLDLSANYPLSDYRKRRLSALSQDEKRRQSLGAELLLNHALGVLVPDLSIPAQIYTDERDKPYITGHPIHFSLAHSCDIAACAVSDVPIGLDVQRQEAVRQRVAERVFSAGEREYLAKAEDKSFAFTMIWAMKESFVKQSGEGVGAMLGRIDVLSDRNIWHQLIDGYHFAIYAGDSESPFPDEIVKLDI